MIKRSESRLNMRFSRAAPMSEEQYEAFHAEVVAEHGLEAQVRKHGGSLMVRSLVNPNTSVPHEQFMQEVAQRNAVEPTST